MGWLDRFRKRPAQADPTSSSVYASSGLPSDIERSFQDTPAVQRYRASRPATLDLPRAAPAAPVKGQRVLLGLTHDKAGAVQFCTARWPQTDLVLPRCRVPHDGIADALCLAEYGRHLENHP